MNNVPIRHTKPRHGASVPSSGARRHPVHSGKAPRRVLLAFAISTAMMLALNAPAITQTMGELRVGPVENAMVRAAEAWQGWMGAAGLGEPIESLQGWVRQGEQSDWASVQELVERLTSTCADDSSLRGSHDGLTAAAGGHDFADNRAFNWNPVCYLRRLGSS